MLCPNFLFENVCGDVNYISCENEDCHMKCRRVHSICYSRGFENRIVTNINENHEMYTYSFLHFTNKKFYCLSCKKKLFRKRKMLSVVYDP